MERTDAINASQHRRCCSSSFQPVAHREARFAPHVLSGGYYRKIFGRYANKGQAIREGSDKRSHRRFRTSKRILSVGTQPIGVEFDELCVRTRYTGWNILRYEEGVGRRRRYMGWRWVVDTNTPNLILRVGGHVRAEVAGFVAIFILF